MSAPKLGTPPAAEDRSGRSSMTLAQRLCFLAGQTGVMALMRFFVQWSVKFTEGKAPGAAEEVQGPVLFVAAAAGALFMIARFFDGVIDPIIGGWSDRWVARGKERRSLLVYSFFIAPVGLALLFSPTLDQPVAVRWALLGGGLFVFFVGYGIYGIPLWSLVDDYGGENARERSTLSNLLGAGILLGVAIGSTVVPMAIKKLGYGLSAIAVGGVAGALMILPYFSKPRGNDQPLADPHAHDGVSLKRMLATLKDKRFLAVLLMFSGSQMALTVVSAAAPFVCAALLQGDEGDVAKLMTPFLGGAIPCFALVPWFARRVGWERAMLYASLALSLVYVGIAALGKGIVGSPMTTAMVLFGLGGPPVAVLLGLEGEAVAKCARASDPKSVSLYFGMFNLCVKALNGLALGLVGLVVTFAHDHPAEAAAATRVMGIIAGAVLFAGVGLYFLVRPKDSSSSTSSASESSAGS
ncbi:MAG: MFS transporter [Polyangiaceae bacterium]